MSASSPTAELRRGRLVLYCGIAQNRDRWGKGICVWCGEPIILADPTDYRRRTRTRHRGDEHEQGDGRNCHKLFMQSYCWTARQLIEWRGDPCCAYCGEITELWEAEHTIALEDGGGRDPTNIVRSCVPCHRRKTAFEASARAERRRLARVASLPIPEPSAQLEMCPA